MARILVVLAVLLAATPALAQDAGAPAGGDAAGPIYVDPADMLSAPEVSAAASAGQVMLGGRFVLVVTAAHDDGVEVILPTTLELGPAFEERKPRKTVDRTRSDGKKVREWQIEILAWDVGELMVPPIEVSFVLGGTRYAVVTNAVPVTVAGTLGDMVDSTQPRGHAPPVVLWRRTWLWVILAGIILGLLGAAATLIVIARRRKQPVIAILPPRVSGIFRRRLGGPAEDALARLDAIDSSGMLARDRKVAYTEMIDVIQEFLGRQLGGDTRDLTTGELRDWLGKAKLSTGQRLELSRWLDECDLVKFGGYRASVEEGRTHLVAAKDLVIAIATPVGGAEAAPEEVGAHA
jgi:hypothetical protein